MLMPLMCGMLSHRHTIIKLASDALLCCTMSESASTEMDDKHNGGMLILCTIYDFYLQHMLLPCMACVHLCTPAASHVA